MQENNKASKTKNCSFSSFSGIVEMYDCKKIDPYYKVTYFRDIDCDDWTMEEYKNSCTPNHVNKAKVRALWLYTAFNVYFRDKNLKYLINSFVNNKSEFLDLAQKAKNMLYANELSPLDINSKENQFTLSEVCYFNNELISYCYKFVESLKRFLNNLFKEMDFVEYLSLAEKMPNVLTELIYPTNSQNEI